MSLITRLRHSPPVNKLRYHAYRDVLLAYPKRHACNICGWRGRHFLSFFHRRVLCPRCGSQIRHRLIAAALAGGGPGAFVRVPGARVLHLSPEYCLSLVFAAGAGHYIRADYSTTDCDLRVDMTAIPLATGAIDIVVACDVLEHVPRDRAALREVYRVLRPGGTAILTVPQFDGDEPTLEDPAVVSPDERARLYGQPDHVRNYGADLADRLADVGFAVRAVDAGAFDPSVVARHVLAPSVPRVTSFGWNRRRVYFATKPSAEGGHP